MKKEEIRNKIATLQAQLTELLKEIQAERQEAKEDENTVIEELLLSQSMLEQQIADLEDLLYSTQTLPKNKFVVHHNGAKKTFSIVHEQLADSSKGLISHSSPLAQALAKAKVGEAFKISTPIGETEYLLAGIE